MKRYLVAYCVINRTGQFMSRAFVDHEGPVTMETIIIWEGSRLRAEYGPDAQPAAIRVTSFQELAP